MGQRSRKRRPADAQERMARGYARGRAKDEAARAALVPLAPGERPRAVTVAALVAAFLGLANVALLGIAIVVAALSLMVASNLLAVVLCLAIIATASPLFWFLIRAMARIQLPVRRPEDPVS